MDETINAIAHDLAIDLTPRGMDDLDVRQVGVSRLHRALEAAYRAGEKAEADRQRGVRAYLEGR